MNRKETDKYFENHCISLHKGRHMMNQFHFHKAVNEILEKEGKRQNRIIHQKNRTMTPEQLMQPRFKVIADYPDNHRWNVGTILDRDWSRYPGDDETKEPIWKISDFPHLFKELEWWEEREVEDMPKYVKSIANGSIVKEVTTYSLNDNMFYADYRGYSLHYYLKFFEPATKEEYEEYQESKTKQQ